MRQSSSSMVSSSPFTYLTYMMIDIPDELVGSYTYGYVNVSFHPPRVTSYTKLSSTLFLSYSWLMMMIIVMMIAIRIAMMMIIGYVYDIDYDNIISMHLYYESGVVAIAVDWSSTSSCMNRMRRRSYRWWWWVESLLLITGIA